MTSPELAEAILSWRSPPTYTIERGGQAITCHACGLTSHNPADVANLYCGRCHRFFAEHPWRGEASVERTP